MRVGSLFSGIGGLDHGLANAGWQHAFFCESDPWRRTVLAHHWPGVPIYDDVRTVARGPVRDSELPDGGDVARGADTGAPAVDLLCGGFPCQDLSVAGQRRGLAGARSGLFHEFARIINTVRPRFVLLENVPGLLSSNGGRDFGVVLGTLADIGYGVGWRTLDSRFFGVPQRRRRVFIIAARADGDPAAAAQRAGEILAVGTRCPGHPATGTEAGQDAAVASLSGLGNGGPDDNDGQAGRLVAGTLKSQRGKGGGIGPEETLIAGPLGGGNDGIGRRSEDDPNLVSAFAWQQGDDSKHGKDGRGRSWITRAGDYTGALSKTRHDAVAGHSTGVRRLTPTECERLQALPDHWTDHGPDSRRYSALGDAVTSTVAEWIGRRLAAALMSHNKEKVASVQQ